MLHYPTVPRLALGAGLFSLVLAPSLTVATCLTGAGTSFVPTIIGGMLSATRPRRRTS